MSETDDRQDLAVPSEVIPEVPSETFAATLERWEAERRAAEEFEAKRRKTHGWS